MPNTGDYRASQDPLDKASTGIYRPIEGPAEWLRSLVLRFRSEPSPKFYHRRFARVPTIDQCGISDQVCRFEADEQFKRDKMVDEQIMKILRKRRTECIYYWGPTSSGNYKCAKEEKDYEDAAENYFIKYGDIGINKDVVTYYMKQKHRMVWERRKQEREAAGMA